MASQNIEHAPRASVTENQSDVISVGGDGKAPRGFVVGHVRGKHKKGTVQLSADVSRETKKRLTWIARELDATECSVVEALINSAFLSFERKVETVLLAKETFIFNDITFQRVTTKVRKIRDRLEKESEILEEFHGNKDTCFHCPNKPVERVFAWNEPRTDTAKCHVTYVCREHLKLELQRLHKLKLLCGHQPI